MTRPELRPLRARRTVRAVVGSTAAVAAVVGLTAMSAGSDDALGSVRDAAARNLAPLALTAADIAPSPPGPALPAADQENVDDAIASRSLSVSRSDVGRIERYEASSRAFVAEPMREAVLPPARGASASPVGEDLTQQDPREIALQLMPDHGLSAAEFSCLDSLWISESDWNMYADNPTSSALGIPQALTSAWDLPADYATNPVSQIEWGLWYISATYGSACNAWNFKQANNWY